MGSRFLLCFSARETDGSLAIGTAWGDGPEGPFEPAGEPLLRGGVIDPHLFVEEGESLLLIWKGDSNAVWPRRLAALLHEDPAVARMLSAIPRWHPAGTASRSSSSTPTGRGR